MRTNMILLPERLYYGEEKWVNLRHIVRIDTKPTVWIYKTPDGWKLRWKENGTPYFQKGPFWDRTVRGPTAEEINNWDYTFDITTTEGLFRCGYFTKSEAYAKIREVRNAVDEFNRAMARA